MMEFLLFATASEPAVGPTQPPNQRILRTLTPGVKRSKREADHSPPSSSEVKSEQTYTSTPPIHLHEVCLIKQEILHGVVHS
jgi:hypothetical protein